MIDLTTYKLLLTLLAGLATLAMGGIAIRNLLNDERGAWGDVATALLGAAVTLGMALGLNLAGGR